MIHNPYPIPTDEDDKVSCRFATYMSAEDKAMLMALRPVRGTPQAVINNLIKNFCDELRELKLDFYRPDADDILAILVERRALSDEQIARLRCTTFGVTEEIPARLRQQRRSSKLRERLANAPSGTNDAEKRTTSRKRRNGKSTASETAAQSETQTNS
jgi:hypothetical protein